MDFVAEMKRKAETFKKSLVLPEGSEERTVQAAENCGGRTGFKSYAARQKERY